MAESFAATASDPAVLTHLSQGLEALPYARHLGLQVRLGAQGVQCVLHAREEHWGNPHLGALHGGVVGAILEIAGQLELLRLGADTPPRVVDSSVEYLRPAVGSVFYAGAQGVRLGRRVAYLHMQLWSEDAARPVALGYANYALAAPLRR